MVCCMGQGQGMGEGNVQGMGQCYGQGMGEGNAQGMGQRLLQCNVVAIYWVNQL